VRVKVKPSCPDLNRFQTVESGVRVRNSIMVGLEFNCLPSL
jgi:hypothetical protein